MSDYFIGKIFEQAQGEQLLVLEKVDKDLYRCQFQKYPYEIIISSQRISRRNILNPQIEKVEFIDKIWKQNCGDSLKILEKITKGENKGKWKCEFIKYPYKIIASKTTIVNGNILNPLIKDEFIGKEFKQNCGDILKVLEQSNTKKNNTYLYRCQFQKYPCEILETKDHILRGVVNNPQILLNTFIGKEFLQNCGDILKVIELSKKQNKNKQYLYKCEFKNYPSIIYALKSDIKRGKVENPNLPWKTKENFKRYIINNFNNKPTELELSQKLNISVSLISNLINQWNLQSYLNFAYKNQENTLRKYIESLKIKTEIVNTKDYEIDIYIPSLKIGFEYNGNFWHSNHPKFGKDNQYHQRKSLYFENQNIQIIHIWEWEWKEKYEIIKSLIKSKFGIFEKKIGARECIVKELDNKTYQDFCNENHLQGECGAKIKLGLYFKEELVQIMSFGVPRFDLNYQWEIIRECSKLGYFILGGKEKLWRYFLGKCNPESCISYCDFSKFNGNSYLKLGFKKERLNKPGFVWFDYKNKQIFLRTPWKHKEYKDKGYLQLFDCGQLVFIWNKQNL